MIPERQQSHLAHPKYRPDIDGLRAVAVLSVVAFHAFPLWMPGGFIGVDVFFVISGYLISSIIFGSMTGRGFSYGEFYERRVRRIFPALLLVMAATLAFGWYVLLADEFAQLGKHLLAGAGFVVNLVFWGESGYFDTVADTKPLLHFWSLAVEEQFYIFWPILLGWVWKLRGGAGKSLWRWMWAATIFSFLWNVYDVHRHPTATFYSPIPRVWELAAGGLLAWSTLQRRPHRNALRRELRSIIGLALLVLGLALISKSKAFPGWWAILPVAGTVLCISAGPGAWLNRFVLGAKPLVWVGLISYPLYLWHWPLLSFARVISNGEPPRSVRIAAVLAAVVLAWLTYYFVERKLRNRKGAGVVWALAGGMVVVAALGALAWSRMLPPRNDDAALQAIVSASGDWAFPDGLEPTSKSGQVVYTIGRGKERVLLLGDSHVEQFAPRAVELARASPDALHTLYFGTRGACPPIPQLFEDRDPSCGKRREALLRFALGPEIDTVILNGCWTCYFDVGTPAQAASAPPPPDNYYYLDTHGKHRLRGGDGVPLSLASLESLIKLLRSSNKKVYLILNVPVGPMFEPRLLLTGSRLGTMTTERTTEKTEFPATQWQLHEQLRALAQRSGAWVLDPAADLCDEALQCRRADIGGVPIYKDGAHLRARYVRKDATFIDAAITAPR